MPPAITATASPDLLAPSAQYKREALKAVLSIIAFIIVYFLLFVLSLGLVALCVYLGVILILVKIHWLTILLGLGLIGCSVMVLVFQVKFLFASSKIDESDSIEITESDHPKLFQSIRSLSERIGTPMPKKVFLSPDVNAAVFYNSSFWSMFLPVRKNLKIGMGLVNAVNVSQLEAVIAHEFGHFSQRSMKIGSWSYQVNRIIFDMLYNNNGFAEKLSSFASVHQILYFFGKVTIKIVSGIQWVLRQMYKVVNKAYLSLSRQMEFHADLVAASHCGTNNIIGSLRQIQFANECYDTTMNACNKAWEKNQVLSDFYTAFSTVLQKRGEQQQFSFNGQLPIVSQLNDKGSRINFKDQWSSHPTIIERNEYLEPFGLEAPVDTSPAWSLFDNVEEMKSSITEKIYRNVPKTEVKEVLKDRDILKFIQEQLEHREFPAVFQQFYDDRVIIAFDVEQVLRVPNKANSFEEVFNDEIASLPKKIHLLMNDIQVLEAIKDGQIETMSFDFDGMKYSKSEAGEVLERLNIELKHREEQLMEIDRKLLRYFYANLPADQAARLKQDYMDYFEQRTASEKFYECIQRIMRFMDPLYSGSTLETINSIIRHFKENLEPELKEMLETWMPAFEQEPGLTESVENFISKDYQYFFEDSFFENELTELNTIMTSCSAAIYEKISKQFVALIEQQSISPLSPSPSQHSEMYHTPS